MGDVLNLKAISVRGGSDEKRLDQVVTIYEGIRIENYITRHSDSLALQDK